MNGRHIKVNLACGNTFVLGNGWVNFDYTSSSPSVRQANLLGRLPLGGDSAALVYSSHFLEHIPRSDVPAFFHECHRVLTPGGILRLVLPDLENLCRTYLSHRQSGEHDRANFLVLEMLDQCVRRDSGGELGRYYRALRNASTAEAEMIRYVRVRTGEDLLGPSEARAAVLRSEVGLKSLALRLQRRVERLWIRAVTLTLPRAFRAQNVSIAGVGERHHWLWDFPSVATGTRGGGFHSRGTPNGRHERDRGFPLPSAGPRRRRPPAQGR
jgi:SAM-dependent methyltransferase